MANITITPPDNNHAYCKDCDWAATPDHHDYANVHTAADVHAMFNRGHTVREGATEETIEEASSRIA